MSIAFVLASGGSLATSSKGSVEVTAEAGLPCFALSQRELAGPMRVWTLSVSHGERTDWRSLPPEDWGFAFAPPGGSLQLRAGACLRYGALPPGAMQRTAAAPLQPGTLYRIELGAQPEAGADGTVAYEARFCVKPGAANAGAVQPVLWDEAALRWRTEACAAP
ncbi:MAG TPA: hypothetical protein VLA61_12345 [Ideonella sp.]|uniref:hypothetical protein n=1 Tax=Ideonella sp. TaxID=1929293 RepID=UPI002BABF158|nr:hypothetical protein [Ideonella sp.]HSI49053.1 hypothetical protein [Ideonella sp.]